MNEKIGFILLGIILIVGGISLIVEGGMYRTIFIDFGVFASPLGLLSVTFGTILIVYYTKKNSY